MSFYEFSFLVLSEETYYGLLANDLSLTLMIYLATLYFPVTSSFYLTKQYHTRQLHLTFSSHFRISRILET